MKNILFPSRFFATRFGFSARHACAGLAILVAGCAPLPAIQALYQNTTTGQLVTSGGYAPANLTLASNTTMAANTTLTIGANATLTVAANSTLNLANATLAFPSSGVAVGNYGGSAAWPAFAVGADGRVTGAGNVAVPSPNLTISGDASGTTAFTNLTNGSLALTLTNSGVTAGTYGTTDGGNYAVITVDAKGRITGASNVTVSGGSGGGGNVTLNSSGNFTNKGMLSTSDSIGNVTYVGDQAFPANLTTGGNITNVSNAVGSYGILLNETNSSGHPFLAETNSNGNSVSLSIGNYDLGTSIAQLYSNSSIKLALISDADNAPIQFGVGHTTRTTPLTINVANVSIAGDALISGNVVGSGNISGGFNGTITSGVNLPAAQLTGTAPVAIFNGGTNANSTTVLAGNGTWVVPPSASGASNTSTNTFTNKTLNDASDVIGANITAPWVLGMLWSSTYATSGNGSEAAGFSSSDGTAGIQSAINALAAGRGGMVSVWGNNSITTNISITTPNVAIVGVTSGFNQDPNGESEGVNGAKLKGNVTAILIDPASPIKIGAIRLEQLYLVGPGNANGTAGIEITGYADQPQLNHINILNHEYGVLITTGAESDAGTYNSLNALNCGYGLYIANCTIDDATGYTRIINSEFSDCNDQGVYIGTSHTEWLRLLNTTCVRDADSADVTNPCNVYWGGSNGVIANCFIRDAGHNELTGNFYSADGIIVSGNDNVIEGNQLLDNSEGAAIHVQGNNNVIGTNAYADQGGTDGNSIDVLIDSGATNTTVFETPGMTVTDHGTGTNIITGTTFPRLTISGAGGSTGSTSLLFVQSTSSYGGVQIDTPASQGAYLAFSNAGTKVGSYEWDAYLSQMDLMSAGNFSFWSVGAAAANVSINPANGSIMTLGNSFSVTGNNTTAVHVIVNGMPANITIGP